MSEWISVKDKKPENDIVALVSNESGWMDSQMAIYQQRDDVWVMFSPHSGDKYTLDVSHYIEIPPMKYA